MKPKVNLEKNINIDRDLVEKAECFEKDISKFGVTIKPKYELSSPFEVKNYKMINDSFYSLLTKAATTHFPENDKIDDC